MSGKYIINNLKKKDREEGITLISTFSRELFVPIFFKTLEQMKLPREKIHLLIYDNTQDVSLSNALQEAMKGYGDKYKSIRLYKSYLKGRGSIKGSGNERFKTSKLWNIWQMWIRIFQSPQTMVHTPTFFMMEDDTICPSNSFNKLYKSLMASEKIAMVTAIATGRNNKPWDSVRLGVHNVTMKGKKLIRRESFHPDTKGIKEINGAGVYCFVARTKGFNSGFDGFDPISFKTPFFAMDNVLIWNIVNHGYKVLADFSVWCSHLQASAARVIAFGKYQAVEMIDIWIPEINNYAQGIEIKRTNQRNRKYRVRKMAESWEI